MSKSKLTEPEAPHRIKDTEKGRLNPAYVNLTAGMRFTPQESIVYLWSYNSNKELVVGIEYPWQHPEAFNIDIKNEQEEKMWNRISIDLQNLLEGITKHYGFGHTTLAADFDEDGYVKIGLGHLGGELKYINGEWIIDNKSGRYGRYEEARPEVQQLIENTIIKVAELFNEAGVKVTPKLDFEDPKIDSSLYNEQTKHIFFQKSHDSKKEKNELETTKKTGLT